MSAEINEWLDNIKGFLSRCKDTEWDENDESHFLVVKALVSQPVHDLGPTAKKQAYQRLFDYLCSLEKPYLVSEMDGLILIVKKYFSEEMNHD